MYFGLNRDRVVFFRNCRNTSCFRRSRMPLDAITHTFAGSPLDRASDKRTDHEWLRARLEDPCARFVVFQEGRPLVADASEAAAGGCRLALLPAAAPGVAAGEGDAPLFLGLLGDTPLFAVETGAEDGPVENARFEELRGIALALPEGETGIAATAKSLFDWRRRHRFCSACGAATEDVAWGWRRQCPACGVEHFPRVDPVVIMLPVFGERCMLGRGAGWPPGRMSALAGFLEPGESIEEACAREMLEEAGLVATRVVYHSSQPWPWPSSLMIGLVARVENYRATPDGVELEDARWFTREEARQVLAGTHPDVTAPAPLAIARHLLEAWVEGFTA
jgi:NAD+ diphosphatase